MARKVAPPATSVPRAVSPERAARLSRLLRLLDNGPCSRDQLLDHLDLDVRGFYRDLGVLRQAGIQVKLIDHCYYLDEDLAQALSRLPFPDPHLTLGEAQKLATGRTAAHRKLKQQLAEILR